MNESYQHELWEDRHWPIRMPRGLPAFGYVAAYDTETNIGYEVLNGVPRDGEKWQRTIVDSNATHALLLLTDVLSSGSDRDFLKRVNAGILAHYRVQKAWDISPEPTAPL